MKFGINEGVINYHYYFEHQKIETAYIDRVALLLAGPTVVVCV